MELTDKQYDILRLVVRGNDDGSLIDLDQLLERLAVATTKQAAQFTIRSLVAKKVIRRDLTVVRRGRRRRLLSPTERGKRLVQGSWQNPEARVEKSPLLLGNVSKC